MPGNTPKEVHLFILWEKGRTAEAKILADIAKRFKILKTYEVRWSKKNFARNLSRFYGTNLPPNSRKEVHVGNGPFLAVIVEDSRPVHKVHTTSKGDKRVNSKMFLAKTAHREWTGGGHRIHATNTPTEADHDLTLLFGKNTHDLFKGLKSKDGRKPEPWRHDVVGADGWDSLKQFFYVLNNTIDYVVLRNFEPLPDKYYAASHGDIDLLTTNYKDICFITNSKPAFKSNNRVHNLVRINGEKVRFDFRSLEDNYYDERWERTMLDQREVLRGFYVPPEEDQFYSLLYHALIHKPEIAPDYIKHLVAMGAKCGLSLDEQSFKNGKAVKLLAAYLLKRDYRLTQANDKSVYFHGGHARVIAGEGVGITKQRRLSVRNFLKKHKVPAKHYLHKIKRVARGYRSKLTDNTHGAN